MAKTVDDRVVAMSFETQKFTQGVSTTLSSIDKLKNALRFADAGKGFADVEKAASKVSLSGASSAIDKLKSKLSFSREASEGLGEIDKAGNKVKLDGPANAADKLRGKFQFPEAANAFSEIEKGAGKVTLSGLSNALDGIGNKFGVLEGVASVAIGNIVSKMAMIGGAKLKEFSLGPITDGLHEYETNLNSIQTILANTKDQGTNLKQVNQALQDLNTYSDKTIYNFSQMAKNIGTFTAAGVDLKTATTSIKGIANLAAVSGSSAEQASTAMYQLSQAIASGRVSLQDWNSVVNAGMGGAVFQKSLIRTAQAMGTLKDGAVQLDKATGKAKINGESFRESIMAKPGEVSWLTSDVLTNTLSQLSGDMTDAQLKAQGFNDAQIKAIREQAKMAVNAATQVKTLTQLLDTTKEAIGSGWAQTWQLVFGDFGEAKSMFTALSNSISGMIKTSANARNAVLKDWKQLGGRKILIEGLKDAFAALKSVIDPIKAAFRDVFPRKTGHDLLEMTKRFRDFMESLKINSITAANLRSTFKGLFALLDIGVQVVKGIVSGLGALIGELRGDGGSTITNFTGNIGDAIYAFDQWLKSGNRIQDFFKGLGKILAQPLKVIKNLVGHINDLFNIGGDASGLSSSAGELTSAFGPMGDAVDTASGALHGFLNILGKVYDFMQPAVQEIADTFGNIGDTIAEAIASNDFSNVFSVLQTGLIAGILLTLKKGLGKGVIVKLGTGGALKGITSSLDTLNGSLKAIQNNIKAKTMLSIAAAVALLAASAVALSMIDPKKLTTAMTALTVSMGQLMASLFIMDKVGGKTGFVKAPLIAASLIGIAAAVDILVLAVLALSRVDPKKLATGLAGLTGMLGALSLAIFPLSKAGPGLLIAAPALIGIATAVTILSGAVLVFSTMKWGEMLRGLAGVVLAIDALALSSRALAQAGPGMIVAGVGLSAMGVALTILGGAVKIFGSMDWSTIGKGLAGIAGSLLAIGIAMGLMPPTLPLIGAGLILVGVALTTLAGVIAILGNMDVGTLAKGIIAMGAALAALAIGLNLMITALPGAVALTIVAAGLAILVPLIGLLGNMKISTIAKGIGLMVASLVALSIAGAVAAPGLVALGAALTVLGAGIVLVGTGLYLMTSALVKLAGPGAKGIAVTLAAFTAFIAILPKVIINFVKGLVEILAAIAELAPKVAVSIAKILDVILGVIIKEAPRVAQAMIVVISALIKVIDKAAPQLIKAGGKILLTMLKGIDKNIVEVTKRAISIITKFLNTVASKANQLVTAGLNVLINFLKGIANNLGKVASAALSIVTEIIKGIVGQARKLIDAGVGLITSLLKGITNSARKIVDAGVKIVVNIVKGVGNAATKVATAALKLVTKFITTIAGQIPKEVNKVATAIIRMMNALATVIRKREPEFIRALANIGHAVVAGIVDGMTGLGKAMLNKIKDEVGSLPKKGIALVRKAIGASVNTLPDGIIRFAGQTITRSLGAIFDIFEQSSVKNLAVLGDEGIRILYNLGNDLTTSFRQGLLSGIPQPEVDPVNQAMSDFVKQIGSSQEDLEQKILDSNAKIKQNRKDLDDAYDELRKARKIKDKSDRKDAIDGANEKIDQLKREGKEARKALKAYEDLYHILVDTGTYITFTGKDTLTGWMSDLIAVRKSIEALNDELEIQTQNLEDLKQKRKSLWDQTFEKFSNLPALVTEDENGNPIDPATQVQNYINSLSNADDAVGNFSNSLDTLAGMGLNSDTYQQLLDIGPAAQGFVDALIAAGPGAVAAINGADADLHNAATILADHGASYLYDAGIKTAQGLVDGIKVKINDAVKTAEDIADKIIKAIKKKLKIKSPSQVFAQIGAYSVEGMAKGMTNSSQMVKEAIYGVSDDAKDAIKRSMRGISDMVMAEVNTDPVITPVLDLSQIQAGAKQIGTILPGSSIVLASGVTVPGTGEDLSETGQAAPIQFNQYNTSPESLSAIEIYRQTRNQLAQARPVLASP